MIPQLIANILIAAATTALVAVGFALIYSTTRFFHFAHGIVFTAGAYFAYLFQVILGITPFVAYPLAVICAGLLGGAMDIAVYRPLRKKHASPMILLLASLGLYIALQNTISMTFGDDTKTIRTGEVKEGLPVLGARITPIQIVIIVSSIVLITAVYLLHKKTRFGKTMRAVANDPNLARVSGVQSNSIILLTFLIGSALAGIAGVLIALDIDMTPIMGLDIFIIAIVIIIIGGKSINRIPLASLFLNSIAVLAAWYLNVLWQNTTIFIVLLLFFFFSNSSFAKKELSYNY